MASYIVVLRSSPLVTAICRAPPSRPTSNSLVLCAAGTRPENGRWYTRSRVACCTISKSTKVKPQIDGTTHDALGGWLKSVILKVLTAKKSFCRALLGRNKREAKRTSSSYMGLTLLRMIKNIRLQYTAQIRRAWSVVHVFAFAC